MDLNRTIEALGTRPRREPASRRPGAAAGRGTTIFVSQRLGASPDRAFHAWTDPTVAARWWFATATQPMTQVHIDPQPGGTFRLSDGAEETYSGTFVDVVAPHRLIFDLALAGHAPLLSRVEVAFAALPHGCRIEMTHREVPPAAARYLESRWIGMFYGLGLLLDPRDASE